MENIVNIHKNIMVSRKSVTKHKSTHKQIISYLYSTKFNFSFKSS